MELQVLRPPWAMSGDDAVAALDALHAEFARLETYRLGVLARLEETGRTKEISGESTVRFVSARYRLNQPQVQRDLNLAAALSKYPAVSAALPDPFAPPGDDAMVQYADAAEQGADETGEELLPVLLHVGQAEAIVSALEAVPTANVTVEELLVAERQLVEAARHLRPGELTKFGRQVRDVLDTDGPEPAEEAAARREALRLTNADRGVKFSGFLANDNAELFRTLVEAAAKPHKVDGQLDPRSREKRQADALAQILTAAADTGDLPGRGGVKPHVTVTIDYADLVGGARNATGELQFGDGLAASAVRRLACDAGIIPVVLGSESEPLDVGREHRFVTKALRHALNRRDKGCVVCGAAPRYCHAHHIVHWADGGTTSLENLALLCSAHHLAVHAGRFTVTITNGKVQVTRPHWTDPPRRSPAVLIREAIAVGEEFTAPDGGTALCPVRAFPLVEDPPPFTADTTPDFNPWASANLDTG
ncbi:HNH endonuclease [Kribbella monticola]|uniref:HNH endonuclease n=1 Tax=Kribbella monticola TaxID=2185285 RepID=UPI0013006450|nr:HNH endonuclease signature motif containing protein [Kribbella monticola]